MLDAQDGRPLPGATVLVLGTQQGAVADEEGRFLLPDLPPGPHALLVSHVGYRARTVRGLGPASGEVVIALRAAAVELPGVVVSATRRAQAFAEAPVSICVAGPRQIAVQNSLSLAGPVAQMAGVSQVGGEVNIRGSSGYSRGTGSRVLLLLDGAPLLAADLGDIKWDVIPVDQVERVEVIKGAGSALYGTGALGGVINVITRDPGEEPQTRFRLLSGLYTQPAHAGWEWTDDPMYVAGVEASHTRRAGRTGWILSAGHQRGTGYSENDEFVRYRAYAKAVHRFSPLTQWRTAAVWAVDDHGVFVQWKDRAQPLRVPAGDRGASTVSWKLNLRSEWSHLHTRQLGVRLRTAYYRTGFDNSEAAGGLTSSGHKAWAEAQADYTGWPLLDLTGGTAATYDRVRSPGDFLGRRSVANLALYGQAVHHPRPGADLALGLRYDWHRRGSAAGAGAAGFCPEPGAVPSRVEHQVSPQLALSWRPAEGTAVRASGGAGFRAPTVSEVFTQALVSGLRACPNPDLKAERSWSWEVGLKQEIGGWSVVDAALFWNTYDGLVEGRADPAAGGAAPVARFRNLDRARVAGLEVEQLVALPHGLRLRGAYTYLSAVERVAPDEVLPPFASEDLVPGTEAPLPYRPRHQLTVDLVAAQGGGQAGATFAYTSAFARVSGLFPEGRRDVIPAYLVDVFAGYSLGAVEVNLRVDNLLQYHYLLVERNLRPLRRVSLAVSGAL
ncbi:MAG: TonB-dependent receptor [Candidatus Latescibacterota bacterium]